MSYIGWVQAGGAWALCVLPFQICPRVCLLLMRLRNLVTLRLRFLAFHAGVLLVFRSIQELGLI